MDAQVRPQGLAAAILGITCALGALSLVTVTLRAFVRYSSKQFGLDDGLMLVGMVLYIADCAVVWRDTFVGLGSKNDLINPAMQSDGIKYLLFWQIFYVTSLCAVKCSICMTLLRIAIDKAHRITVYSIIFMTCVTSIIGFVGVMSTCRPISASWTGKGSCASTDVITNLSYLVSASSIVTDWACAVVPAFILWKTQMRRRTKISVVLLLTLGTLASITTVARIPFLRYYREPTNNFLFHMGIVVLLSIAECGIGLIAGSLPMLRPLLRAARGSDNTEASYPKPESPATFGGTGSNADKRKGSRRHFANPTDRGITLATIKTSRRSGRWQTLDDTTASDYARAPSSYIVEHRTVRVEYEARNPSLSEHSRSSSREQLKGQAQ